jgi:hypothetical protein
MCSVLAGSSVRTVNGTVLLLRPQVLPLCGDSNFANLPVPVSVRLIVAQPHPASFTLHSIHPDHLASFHASLATKELRRNRWLDAFAARRLV